MKNYLLVLVSIFTLSFTTVTNAQDEITATAVYNGFNGESYSFTTVVKENEKAKTIEFSDVSAEILKQFDLKSDAIKGEHFFITYVVETETTTNDEGEEEDVEVYVLKTIKEAAY
ncbi:hypothetical protein [Hwangdonia lutea]|uniref:Uncharacterized protein n=1 Tax=Hwangdonia lutea TaxID=3075823 RepID=A0AA97HR12_9FLAO|nr:hypothetical protein [Hwangdonia sp. SCSIO 19198]WOD44506.1 hypothetical protein RNZ46_04435 [Hwangdonia sp. SCSIO 19198]